MRIAFVAPQPFVEYRGTPMANFRITQVLADAGHSVDVITFPFGEDPHYPGINVRRCRPVPAIKSVGIGFSPAKLLLDISLAGKALRLIRRGEYDCIHCVEEGVFIGLALSRLARIPLIYDMDSVLSHEIACSPLRKIPGMVRIAGAAERLAIRSAALVVTISDSMVDYVRRIDPHKDVVAVPDVPVSCAPGGPDPERARSQMPLDMIAGRKILAYTGSLASYQGLDMLMSAMGRVVEHDRSVVLVVVGGDEKGIRRLSEAAERAGAERHVLFMGKKPSEQVPDFLSAADILLSPRRGGVNPPAKIYTYMQSGKPIVATDIPAHSSVLGSDAAILVSPTPEGIADGILRALAAPHTCAAMADRARAIVSEITPELQARRVHEAYDLLCARLGARPSRVEGTVKSE